MMNTVSREALEIAKKESPMQRMGEPEEVASLVAFLSSDESSYVSGECIRCGGAYHT
jgi:3-oxoacyl-[acyl-carrier protein] reductase